MAIIAIPKAVICITANPALRPIAVIVNRSAKFCGLILDKSQRTPRAAAEKITIAPAKLSPTQSANFQSRAATQIKKAQVVIANKATQAVASVASSNSFRINRMGETFARPSNGGPANPNNRTQVNRMLHKMGPIEIDGKLPKSKLPNKPVSTSCTR